LPVPASSRLQTLLNGYQHVLHSLVAIIAGHADTKDFFLL
jgi:hypothetical protein